MNTTSGLSSKGETTFESALTRLKKIVYKNRVRVKEFLVDFDKLRSGFVHPNHFLTALVSLFYCYLDAFTPRIDMILWVHGRSLWQG